MSDVSDHTTAHARQFQSRNQHLAN